MNFLKFLLLLHGNHPHILYNMNEVKLVNTSFTKSKCLESFSYGAFHIRKCL